MMNECVQYALSTDFDILFFASYLVHRNSRDVLSHKQVSNLIISFFWLQAT